MQESVAAQTTGKDYMQIALGILKEKDLSEPMKSNSGLREWAVNLLQYYSPVKLDEETAKQLISGKVQIPVAQMDYPEPARRLVFSLEARGHKAASSPDGSIVASSDESGSVDVWRKSGDRFTVQTRAAYAKGLAFAPDGKTLVVFSGIRKIFAILPNISLDKEADLQITVFDSGSRAGIESVRFEGNDIIVVKTSDGKESRYSLHGELIG